MLPKQIQKFIENFSQLPSIGPRMARRLSFYLVGLDEQKFKNLEEALSSLEDIDRCPRCFFMKTKDEKICKICSNSKRDRKTIAIVEKETDLLSLEKTSEFKGVYMILSESSGSGSLKEKQKLRLKHLKKIIKRDFDGKVNEIIVATNPNTHGDFIAQIIKKEFKENANKITRLGRGLPTGGEIEFADSETLSKALERRGN